MIKHLIFGLSLALAAGAALAQEEWNFEDWDAESDGSITEIEFNEGFEATELFDSWDVDDSGVLSEEEFSAGLFESWDQTGNDLFEAWDVDDSGGLSEGELSAGLFEAWDEDDNDLFGEEEWNEVEEEGWFDF